MLKVEPFADAIRPLAVHVTQLAAQSADEAKRRRRPRREVDFAEETRFAVARVARAERESISGAREAAGQPQIILIEPGRRLMLRALVLGLRGKLEHRALMFCG